MINSDQLKEIQSRISDLHKFLQIERKKIEISNDEITLAVILFVGFENEEYEAIKNRENLHLVSFSDVVATMNEFRHLKVKYVDPLSWLFMILSRSSHPELVDLRLLKGLKDV